MQGISQLPEEFKDGLYQTAVWKKSVKARSQVRYLSIEAEVSILSSHFLFKDTQK